MRNWVRTLWEKHVVLLVCMYFCSPSQTTIPSKLWGTRILIDISGMFQLRKVGGGAHAPQAVGIAASGRWLDPYSLSIGRRLVFLSCGKQRCYSLSAVEWSSLSGVRPLSYSLCSFAGQCNPMHAYEETSPTVFSGVYSLVSVHRLVMSVVPLPFETATMSLIILACLCRISLYRSIVSICKNRCYWR